MIGEREAERSPTPILQMKPLTAAQRVAAAQNRRYFMRDFRSVQVWQKAHELTVTIHMITRDFDQAERYGLTRDIRRTCSSVPASIACGCGYSSDADFYHFCETAMGRACALEYYLLLASDIGLMNDVDFERVEPDLIETKKMLWG